MGGLLGLWPSSGEPITEQLQSYDIKKFLDNKRRRERGPQLPVPGSSAQYTGKPTTPVSGAGSTDRLGG